MTTPPRTVEVAGAPLDLSWLDAKAEWGARGKPTKRGLTLRAINVGTYGEIPDVYTDETEMPRGAVPKPGSPAVGHTIFEKAEIWCDSAPDLYEEGVQRRWRPAIDIEWANLPAEAPDARQAVAQICTELSQQSLTELDVIAHWLYEISYGFHEVKALLAQQEFEAARHFEVFRKRAVVNGGRLGLEAPARFQRRMVDAKVWAEVSLYVHLIAPAMALGVYQTCQRAMRNPVDQTILRLVSQDASRRLSYGVERTRVLLAAKPERRPQLLGYLARAELAIAEDWANDTPFWEALAILLGGGLANIEAGLQAVAAEKGRILSSYARRLEGAGLERPGGLTPALAAQTALENA